MTRRVLYALIILLFAFIIFALTTTAGLNIVFRLVQPFIPGELSIEKLEGRILGDIKIGDFSYEYESQIIKIKRLRVQWRLRDLIQKKFYIQQLDGEDIYVDLPWDRYAEGESSPEIKLYLPLTVEIASGDIQNITFVQDGVIPDIQAQRAELQATLLPGDDDADMSITTKLMRVEWPLTEDLSFLSDELSVDTSGTINDYHFDIRGHIGATKLPLTDSIIIGYGNLDRIHFTNMSGSLLSGEFVGQGMLDWDTDIIWQADFNLNKLDPSQFWSVNPGSISFEVLSSGKDSDSLEANLKLLNLHGEYDGSSLAGSVGITFTDGIIEVDDSQINVGSAVATFAGGYQNEWHGRWVLDVDDLETLVPDMSGDIHASGDINGSKQEINLMASLSANDISYQSINIANLTADLDVKDLGNKTSHLRVSVKDFSPMPDYLVHDLTLNLTGTQEDHRLAVQMESVLQEIKLSLQGGYQNKSWGGQVSSLNLVGPKSETWQLAKPTKLDISMSDTTLENLCLIADTAKFCMEADFADRSNWNLDFKAKKTPLFPLGILYHEQIDLDANLDAQGQVTVKDNQINADVTAQIAPGRLAYIIQGSQDFYSFAGGDLKIKVDSEGFNSTFSLNATKGKLINMDFNMPGYHTFNLPKADQKLKGDMQLNISSLEFVSVMYPGVQNIIAALHANLGVAGTWSEPIFSASAQVENASLKVPASGLDLQAINLDVEGAWQQPLSVKVSAKSGEGNIVVTGNSTSLDASFDSEWHIEGENFLTLKSDDAKVYMSPDLMAQYADNQLHITGKVTIPKAEVHPKDFSSTIQMPKDVVYVRDTPSVREQKIDTHTVVEVELGDEVNFAYQGLTAKLGGSFTINDNPEGITTAIGELVIEKGLYAAYGQELRIVDGGRLLFSGGPVDNPGLSIQAVRDVRVFSSSVSADDASVTTASRTIVGINISGTLEEPIVNLFSIPGNLTNTQILSYIVLGYGLDQANTTDAATLASAAAALSLSNSSVARINERLKDTFGLSDLTITSEDEYSAEKDAIVQNTSLVLGKYLTPDLYINYSIGLAEPINILTVTYRIDNNWSVQSEGSTSATGVDLLYTIEVD